MLQRGPSIWGCAGLVMGHPVHHRDTARPRHRSTHQSPTNQGEEQGIGPGSNGWHPLLSSTQAPTLQRGFDCFLGYF